MKARDLTPACIGRQIRVGWVRHVEGTLTRITVEKNAHGYLDLYLTVDGQTIFFTGDEPVTITG